MLHCVNIELREIVHAVHQERCVLSFRKKILIRDNVRSMFHVVRESILCLNFK